MEVSFKFLLQSSRILSDKIYQDRDLIMIHNFLLSIDNKELNEYLNNKTIFSYKNDLELYIEVAKNLLVIFEEDEKYELCQDLKIKIDECNLIINNKKLLNYE